MSIFIIRGPEAAGALIRTAMPLPAPVLKSLVHRAIDAGTSVAIRACGSEQELLDEVHARDLKLDNLTDSYFKTIMGITEALNGLKIVLAEINGRLLK